MPFQERASLLEQKAEVSPLGPCRTEFSESRGGAQRSEIALVLDRRLKKSARAKGRFGPEGQSGRGKEYERLRYRKVRIEVFISATPTHGMIKKSSKSFRLAKKKSLGYPSVKAETPSHLQVKSKNFLRCERGKGYCDRSFLLGRGGGKRRAPGY